MGGLYRERGLTLIEVLVSVAILGLLVMPVFELFRAGMAGDALARTSTVATALCQEKLEALRHSGYTAIQAEAAAPVPGFTAYTREVLVTSPETGLKQVTVIVTWTIMKLTRSVRLTTLVAGGG
ncbi:MAG: type II secretion system protein [Bacillota bacterium]